MDGSRNESPKALGQGADNQCLTTHYFGAHVRFQADHPLPSPYLAFLLALHSQMEVQEVGCMISHMEDWQALSTFLSNTPCTGQASVV